MPSHQGSGQRPDEDLSPRARIRDAAMAEFADHGFTAATIKGIAAAAGVSTGLVQHHFGTKEALRRACDEATVAGVRRQLEAVDNVERDVADPGFTAALYDTAPLHLRYLIRLLIDDAPAAAWLFDEMAAGTERFLSAGRPDLFPPGSAAARDGATVMLAMHLGSAVLHAQVARRLGTDPMTRDGAPRIGLVMLDVYTTMAEWVASDTGQQARAAVAHYLDTLPPSSTGRDKEHLDD